MVFFQKIALGCAAVVAFMAQISYHDAQSNFITWLEEVDLSEFVIIHSPPLDSWVLIACIVVNCFLLVPFQWYRWAWSLKNRKAPALESEPDPYDSDGAYADLCKELIQIETAVNADSATVVRNDCVLARIKLTNLGIDFPVVPTGDNYGAWLWTSRRVRICLENGNIAAAKAILRDRRKSLDPDTEHIVSTMIPTLGALTRKS